MAEVVDQRHALGKVLVQLQGARERTGDLRDLDRMGQARPEMIAVRADEDLCLVLQAPERGRMDDAVAVALEFRTGQAAVLGKEPPA